MSGVPPDRDCFIQRARSRTPLRAGDTYFELWRRTLNSVEPVGASFDPHPFYRFVLDDEDGHLRRGGAYAIYARILGYPSPIRRAFIVPPSIVRDGSAYLGVGLLGTAALALGSAPTGLALERLVSAIGGGFINGRRMHGDAIARQVRHAWAIEWRNS